MVLNNNMVDQSQSDALGASAHESLAPPFVHVEGIPNFRELGGYSTNSSKSPSVRRDIIYRCGDPSRVTPNGIKTLQELRISHAFDLRSESEIQRSKDAGRGGPIEWVSCKRVFVPVFRSEDYSPEGIAARYKDYSTGGPEVGQPIPSVLPSNGVDELFLKNFATQGFTRAYSDIMDNAPGAYGTILRHLAHEPEKPIIIHCTAGKDRTGVLCALILSLCGVDDETVSYEYSLTELGLAQYKEQIMQHLMTNPALKDNPQGALNMMGAR